MWMRRRGGDRRKSGSARRPYRHPYDPFESVYTAEAVESGAVARPMLFIEDIAEPIYKVERILWQLHLRGVFRRVSAVLVGQFTEYSPSADHPDMYTMMHRFFGSIGIPDIPIVYDLPVGHVEANAPCSSAVRP